ncbi:cardiolipin synthase [Campylobacter sp. MIT 99-7217]|uniref:cardiolipin synthase n=1 Tax=Campylobacter sp. MIT 99-7217 TaxID=535091 RepID=UPI00115BF834|nr:cardiolipin synthase [Campylobacter sp. MIT 99-7217]TQR32338.1 cardiolipin synthase [Campylobacter sp. MIT 99-7217]
MIFYILTILFFTYVAIITLRMLLENRSPNSILAWFMVLVFLPYVGAFLYIFFGIDWKKSKEKISAKLPEDILKKFLSSHLEDENTILKKMKDHKLNTSLMNLALNTAYTPITTQNEVEIFYEGKMLFDRLLEDLRQAKTSIHMQYYIFRSDTLGKRIKEVLIQKAKEGVDIRLIFDGLGSLFGISAFYKRDLKKHGIKFLYFHDPFFILWTRFINYRNHRKIVVIDGNIAYTGGMNVGQEYIDGGKEFSSWKDTHLRLVGQACHLLQNIFICDWHNSGGEDLNEFFENIEKLGDKLLNYESKLFPQIHVKNYLPMQIITSGPDSKWGNIQRMYSKMINLAKKNIYIQTPYFVPDESFLQALENAALSGVKTHLMIAGIPDHKLSWWVAQTYFENLLNAGVKIYLYEKGFLHSKSCCIDTEVVCVGSCNIDIRSFYLLYEINAVFYDKKVAQNFEENFNENAKYSRLITLQEYQKQNILIRLRNSICRLFAPML